ncbi:hypothetical protein GC169_07550 [bacterium]|nr:hypothetical protein [bacterium]
MSFREKSAWITVISVFGCFGAYFGAIALGYINGRGADSLRLLTICAVALVLVQGALHLVAVRTSGSADRAHRDEREEKIIARSHTVGFYTLMVLVLLLGVPGHLGHSTPAMLNFVLLDVVLATLVVALTQIVLFRRGG